MLLQTRIPWNFPLVVDSGMVFMFWISFWNFDILLEITVLKSIAEEPLVGETLVRCNFTIIFISKFHINIYPAMFVSLGYIHVNNFDN